MHSIDKIMRDIGKSIWEEIVAEGAQADDACRALAEALAYGLNEGDFAPKPLTDLIAMRFDELHIAKYLGPVQ